jgi:hypothetical protein
VEDNGVLMTYFCELENVMFFGSVGHICGYFIAKREILTFFPPKESLSIVRL